MRRLASSVGKLFRKYGLTMFYSGMLVGVAVCYFHLGMVTHAAFADPVEVERIVPIEVPVPVEIPAKTDQWDTRVVFGVTPLGEVVKSPADPSKMSYLIRLYGSGEGDNEARVVLPWTDGLNLVVTLRLPCQRFKVEIEPNAKCPPMPQKMAPADPSEPDSPPKGGNKGDGKGDGEKEDGF